MLLIVNLRVVMLLNLRIPIWANTYVYGKILTLRYSVSTSTNHAAQHNVTVPELDEIEQKHSVNPFSTAVSFWGQTA